MDFGIPQQNKSPEERMRCAYEQLLQYGFKIVKNEKEELSFSCGDVLISITVDSYAHEIEAYFHYVPQGITIRLHDALSYCVSSPALGLYQFSSATQIPKGIASILESILFIIVQNHEDLEDFICKVNHCVQIEQKAQAENLEMKTKLAQSDQMWKIGRRQEAAQIYARYERHLSKVQLKRLSYYQGQDGSFA